jgi:hypothetical protein
VTRVHDGMMTEHGPRIYVDNFLMFTQLLKGGHGRSVRRLVCEARLSARRPSCWKRCACSRCDCHLGWTYD